MWYLECIRNSLVQEYDISSRIAIALCKTVVSPVHSQWRYCSLPWSHHIDILNIFVKLQLEQSLYSKQNINKIQVTFSSCCFRCLIHHGDSTFFGMVACCEQIMSQHVRKQDTGLSINIAHPWVQDMGCISSQSKLCSASVMWCV